MFLLGEKKHISSLFIGIVKAGMHAAVLFRLKLLVCDSQTFCFSRICFSLFFVFSFTLLWVSSFFWLQSIHKYFVTVTLVNFHHLRVKQIDKRVRLVVSHEIHEML